MKSLKISLILLFAYVATPQSFGQETLQEKYDDMIESTETYEQYKVIPRSRLDGFWTEVTDSIKRNEAIQKNQQNTILEQQAENVRVAAVAKDFEAQLSESLDLNDTIYFLGIPFSKVGYHLMVWLIIVVLAVLGVLSYLMFLRSNRVTTRVKKEHEELIVEFDAHKDKARETQVKLKRELQTALNNLNERR